MDQLLLGRTNVQNRRIELVSEEVLRYVGVGMPVYKSKIDRTVADLQQFFHVFAVPEAEQRAFLAEVCAKAIPSPIPSLPDKATSLWMDRTDRKQTPPDFIRHVYDMWLGNGLTQAHISHIDKQLYTALHNWLRSNPMPADLARALPTKSQMVTRQLAQADPRDIRQGNRLTAAANMRRLRSPQHS